MFLVEGLWTNNSLVTPTCAYVTIQINGGPLYAGYTDSWQRGSALYSAQLRMALKSEGLPEGTHAISVLYQFLKKSDLTNLTISGSAIPEVLILGVKK